MIHQALIDDLASLHTSTQMEGWDFSVLRGRVHESQPTWDFRADCLAAMRSGKRIVDLGTGGGERLIELISTLGPQAEGNEIIATEGWVPNVPVARANLAPWGIRVEEYDPESDPRSPFSDASVDCVMSSHEGIDFADTTRILTENGVLLTQQVDGFNAPELHDWFEVDFAYPNVTLDSYVSQCEAAGLTVTCAQEWAGSMTFTDLRALVSYLALVPWEVPDFDVHGHAQRLIELSQREELTVTQKRFRLYAQK
ncbi:class I SAM-dependent methyltransferase [Schaalia canis]|nr:class I SAM-dependent methyltransferase [Schaalia canis]